MDGYPSHLQGAVKVHLKTLKAWGWGGVAVGTSWALGDYVLKLTFYYLGDLADPPEVKRSPESTQQAIPSPVIWLSGIPGILWGNSHINA